MAVVALEPVVSSTQCVQDTASANPATNDVTKEAIACVTKATTETVCLANLMVTGCPKGLDCEFVHRLPISEADRKSLLAKVRKKKKKPLKSITIPFTDTPDVVALPPTVAPIPTEPTSMREAEAEDAAEDAVHLSSVEAPLPSTTIPVQADVSEVSSTNKYPDNQRLTDSFGRDVRSGGHSSSPEKGVDINSRIHKTRGSAKYTCTNNLSLIGCKRGSDCGRAHRRPVTEVERTEILEELRRRKDTPLPQLLEASIVVAGSDEVEVQPAPATSTSTSRNNGRVEEEHDTDKLVPSKREAAYASRIKDDDEVDDRRGEDHRLPNSFGRSVVADDTNGRFYRTLQELNVPCAFNLSIKRCFKGSNCKFYHCMPRSERERKDTLEKIKSMGQHPIPEITEPLVVPPVEVDSNPRASRITYLSDTSLVEARPDRRSKWDDRGRSTIDRESSSYAARCSSAYVENIVLMEDLASSSVSSNGRLSKSARQHDAVVDDEDTFGWSDPYLGDESPRLSELAVDSSEQWDNNSNNSSNDNNDIGLTASEADDDLDIRDRVAPTKAVHQELCARNLSTTGCIYGSRCRFVHDLPTSEVVRVKEIERLMGLGLTPLKQLLVPMPEGQEGLLRTTKAVHRTPCAYFLTVGGCLSRSSCKFAHRMPENERERKQILDKINCYNQEPQAELRIPIPEGLNLRIEHSTATSSTSRSQPAVPRTSGCINVTCTYNLTVGGCPFRSACHHKHRPPQSIDDWKRITGIAQKKNLVLIRNEVYSSDSSSVEIKSSSKSYSNSASSKNSAETISRSKLTITTTSSALSSSSSLHLSEVERNTIMNSTLRHDRPRVSTALASAAPRPPIIVIDDVDMGEINAQFSPNSPDYTSSTTEFVPVKNTVRNPIPVGSTTMNSDGHRSLTSGQPTVVPHQLKERKAPATTTTYNMEIIFDDFENYMASTE